MVAYILPVIFAAMVALGAVIYAWRQRPSSYATAYAVLMSLLGIWAMPYADELASPTLDGKVFWNRLVYSCTVLVPPTILLIAIRFSGYNRMLTRLRQIPLWIIPIASIFLAWTNDWHHGVVESIRLQSVFPVQFLILEPGKWLWLHLIYSILLMIGAILFISITTLRKSPFYLEQTIVLISSLLLPGLIRGVYIFSPLLFQGYDPTTILFGLSSVISAWLLFDYRSGRVVPIIRSILVQNLYDGMILVDADGAVIDSNSQAAWICGIHDQDLAGRDIEDLFRPWPTLQKLSKDRSL